MLSWLFSKPAVLRPGLQFTFFCRVCAHTILHTFQDKNNEVISGHIFHLFYSTADGLGFATTKLDSNSPNQRENVHIADNIQGNLFCIF